MVSKKRTRKQPVKRPKTRVSRKRRPARTKAKPRPKPKAKPKSKPKARSKPKPEPEPKEEPKKSKIDTIEVLDNLGYEVSEELAQAIALLEKHETISENVIAEKLELKINSARKLLYRLKEWGFADYEKQKDPEKTWWYIYFWSLDRKRVLNTYIRYLKTEIEKREVALQEEEEYAFICRRCKLKFTYTEGLETNFNCRECNGILRELKNRKVIRELKREIEEFRAT